MSGGGSQVGSFKILALDGGGLRGVFPATVLASFEESAGGPLHSFFDLIVGTSTGGIIALGLGAGFSAREMLDFYVSKGPSIFPAERWPQRLVRLAGSLVNPKHSLARLESALGGVFGDLTFGNLKTRVVIPAFDATAGRIRIFKTPHHPHIKQDQHRLLREAAVATAAAPYYFCYVTTPQGERFIDGGVWANNPVAVGVIEAIGYLGIARERIRVLSVGTTRVPYHVPRALRFGLWGLLRSRPHELVLAAQSSAALAQAKVLLGDESRLLRIDPEVSIGRFELDRAADISELQGLGRNHATHHLNQVLAEFLNEPVVHPFPATGS